MSISAYHTPRTTWQVETIANQRVSGVIGGLTNWTEVQASAEDGRIWRAYFQPPADPQVLVDCIQRELDARDTSWG